MVEKSLDESWMGCLDRNYRGEILCTMSNVAMIMKNDFRLKGIVFNEMTGNLDIKGDVPWNHNNTGWSNNDFYCLEMYLEQNYRIYSPQKCRDAVYGFLSSARSYHPVADYLKSVQWDGVERIDRILIDYLGAEESGYVMAVMRKTLVAAVARIFEPGVKHDTILVLCGPQGIGKSTLFSKLGGPWYSDSMSIADMKDKTAAEKLQGVWIMELSELAGIRKTDVETVKSFLSRFDDRYRMPYCTCAENHPRKSIIVGTTNSTNGFLRDITGNRRFWPVFVNGNSVKKTWQLERQDIHMFWAEAKELYLAHEKLYLDKQIETEAKMNQRQAFESDPRLGIVHDYLTVNNKSEICLMELWCNCLGNERANMRIRDAYELEGMLCQLGNWQVYKGNKSGKKRTSEFGVQKIYVKIQDDWLSEEV